MLHFTVTTLNFCFQRFKVGKFSCKFIERQKSREHPLVAAIWKRDYFHFISRHRMENKDFSIRVRQSSSSESGLLRILIQLNMFSVSWMDIHISRHEVDRKVGSTFRDMYLTESIFLPFISYDVQRIGYRWDHFVLLKLNVNSTTFERLSFKVKLKSRFDGQGNLTQLNWSSGFSLSCLRDSKVISLPGRIYEAALFLNTETTKLKKNSLNLFWLHENINDDSHRVILPQWQSIVAKQSLLYPKLLICQHVLIIAYIHLQNLKNVPLMHYLIFINLPTELHACSTHFQKKIVYIMLHTT